ncbi:MAG: hypothetical protein JWN44_5892 [Myxococcales bacterium]|nr:hypothetical protein [Myxococcales bacterium]
MKRAHKAFEERTIDELTVEDERSFLHVAPYVDLKEILRRSRYTFYVLPQTRAERWDRALFLNLTFWGAGGDVLVGDTIPADVVAHVAWHHLANHAFARPRGRPKSADALFLGEAIASAFDVYLVGRLLGHAPKSTFLATQVPAMAEAAQAAGLSAARFEAMLQGIARDPDRAFEDLRALLCDATAALADCNDAADALRALRRFDGHRFAALLHRYELSNWILYARAYAGEARDPRVRTVDRALRRSRAPIEYLAAAWVAPALDR